METNRLVGTLVLLLAVGVLLPRPAFAQSQPDMMELASQLRGSDMTARFEAIEALAHQGPAAVSATTELTELLSDTDPLTRVLSASALAVIDPDTVKTMELAIHTLRDSFQNGDVEIQAEAENGLVAIGRPAVPALVSALSDPDPRIRGSAASALGRIGSAAEESVTGLLVLLTDSDDDARASSARALGSIQSEPRTVIPALVRRLNDEVATVRAAAAAGLGGFGPAAREAATELAATLNDLDPSCCVAAASALEKVGKAAEPVAAGLIAALGEENHATCAHAACALANIGEPAVPLLSKSLQDERSRCWAMLALSEIGCKAQEAVPALVVLTDDDDENVRREALLCLGEIGASDTAVLASMVRALRDDVASVRHSSAYALGSIGPPARETLNEIERAMEDEDALQRVIAARALARIDSHSHEAVALAMSDLCNALQHPDKVVRIAAARALGDIDQRSQAIGDALAAALRDEDQEVSASASESLVKLGRLAVPALGRAVDDPQAQLTAMWILGQIGPPAHSAVGPLKKAVRHKQTPVRHTAIATLGEIGPGAVDAVPVLIEALRDAEPPVQYAAAHALGQVGSVASKAIQPLLRATESDDPTLKLVSAWAVAHIGSNDREVTKLILPHLVQGLRHRHPLMRRDAAEGLAELDAAANEALPALRKYSEDDNNLAREAIKRAINRISDTEPPNRSSEQ